jgi:hemerythrin superfamily protein
MQIYEALKKDHEKVKQLLKELVELSDDSGKRAGQIILDIRDELIPHSRAEENVFYNTLRGIDTAKKIALHGYQEHIEAETLLRLLQVKDFFSTDWRATALKLKEAIEHHIEEEEGEIFSAAKQLFTEDEAEAIGETFEKLKPEIKSDNIAKTSLDLMINMLPPRLTDSLRSSNTPN